MIVFDRSSPAWTAVIGAGYLGLTCASIMFSRYGGGVSLVWAGNALLLAALLSLPRGRWPLVLVVCAAGNVLATGLFGLGFAAAPLTAVATVLEAVISAILLQRFYGHGVLDPVWRVGVFAVVAGIVAPAVGGLIGATAAAATTGLPFTKLFIDWYTGHALGALTFTPIFLLLARHLTGQSRRALFGEGRRVEATVLLAVIVAVTWAVFAQSKLPILFLPLLPLVMTSFRFGLAGAAAGTALTVTVATVMTMQDSGPMMLVDVFVARLQLLQFYCATTALTLLAIAAEVEHRNRIHFALVESEARFRLLAEVSGDVVMNLSPTGTIRYASPSIATLGGYDPAALVGRSSLDLVRPADRDRVTAAYRDALAHPDRSWRVQYRALTAGGELQWCETNNRAVADATGKVLGVVSVIRDIAQHKEVEHRLMAAAQTDPLTGIANRAAFDERLQALLQPGAEQAYCAIIDIDFFKRVNDSHGHDVGDVVLRAVAANLASAVRPGELAARIGGEEFGLLLHAGSGHEARARGETLRKQIAEIEVATHNSRIGVTISLGLSLVDPAVPITTIIREADAALYRAKALGRNRLVGPDQPPLRSVQTA